MKNLFKTFRTDLYLTFGLSLITILFIEIWLIKIPEFFEGGELIGQIVLKICYSILAAIVFYFLGVHLRESRNRERILPLLDIYLSKLVRLKNVWLSELYFIALTKHKGELDWPNHNSALITNYYPSKEEIKLLTKYTLYTLTRSPEANWIERIYRLKTEIEQICDSILILDNNLTVKEISLIGELRSCDLFSKVSIHIFRMENGSIIANEDISFIEAELQKFMELFERIEKQLEIQQ